MASSIGLTPLQVAEITKAFSICDTDGNGEIDATELKNVMTHITGETPNEEEIERLLAAVDKDNSGTVSLSEFLDSVGEWLSESSTATKRFKSMTADEEKKELHHQIKGFFSQFKKAENYEAIRQKICESMDANASVFGGRGWFGFRSAGQTAQQKLDFLQQYHAAVGGLVGVLEALTTEGINHLNALLALERLLMITEVFERPSERSAVADDLAQLFEALVRCNLTEMLVNILQTSGDEATHAVALKCLALFVVGPRVPSTPETSLMHPKQFFFKRMAISSDAPLVASRFLNFTSQPACESALLFVRAMVISDVEVRDYFLQNYILSLLCPLVLQTTPTPMLITLAQILAALCGVTHEASPLPPWDLIQPALVPLGHLLFSNEEHVLVNVLDAFSFVLPGMRSDFSIIARLLDLISSHDSPAVVQHAFQTITNIAKFDPIQTSSFMTRGLLEKMKFGLTSEHSVIRSAALDLLEVLACVRQQFDQLLNAGVLEIIATLLPMDDSLRAKLVTIILSLSQSSPLASAMALQGYIQLLCGGLGWFKEYDDVIFEAYAVDGPMFNYELVSDLVSSIENILMVGEVEKMEQSHAFNLYLLNVTVDCVNQMHQVLNALSEITAAGHESWRRERDSTQKGNLEQRLFTILARTRDAIENHATSFQVNSLVKSSILDAISKIFEQFGVNQSGDVVTTSETNPMEESAPVMNALIKCYLPKDIRVFEVARNISYGDLMALLTVKYGRSMLVSFLDAEGDPVRLEASSMNAAFAVADMKQDLTLNFPTIKLQLTERATMPIPPASPSSEDEDAPSASKVPSKKRSRAGEHLTVTETKATPAFGTGIVFAKSKGLDLAGGADLMKGEFASMRLVQKNHSFNGVREASRAEAKFGGQEFDAVLKHLSSGNSLNREQFAHVMNLLGVSDPLVIEQNFNAHDVDRDGSIDFREFAVSLATIAQGSNEDRLRIMFRAYDTDASGNLSEEEVFEIFRAAVQTSGLVADDAQLLQTVKSVFKEIDLDGNGEISFDEFKLAVESGKLPITFEST